MSTPIKDPQPCSNPVTCPGGNCPGCINGRRNCADPVCSPYCHGCSMPSGYETNANTTFAIIAACLLCMILLVGALYVARFFQYNDS